MLYLVLLSGIFHLVEILALTKWSFKPIGLLIRGLFKRNPLYISYLSDENKSSNFDSSHNNEVCTCSIITGRNEAFLLY